MDKEVAAKGYALALILALFPISLVAEGYVLVKFWGWFVMPTFAAAPELSMAAAVGISAMLSMVTHQTQPTRKDREVSEIVIEQIAIMFGKPLLWFVIGWGISWFM